MKLYCVRDHAAGLFGAPFQAPNDAIALRLFEGVQRDADHVWATHARDFQVHYCGIFHEDTGEFLMEPRPFPLITPLPKEEE